MQFQIWNYGLTTLGVTGTLSLIAATTNAFNGALLARRPDHYRHFTLFGVIILGYIGGIGGGVLRDVLVNKIPSPLVNPWYLIFCLLAGVAALLLDYAGTQRFKEGLFQFATAFTLPWYAVVGAQAAIDAKLGLAAAIVIGVIATTGGRFIIDIACNVIPKQLVRGEFFVLTAALTVVVYLVSTLMLGWSEITGTIVAVVFGFVLRIASQTFGWEELEPWEPDGLADGEKSRDTLQTTLHIEINPAEASNK
jgi:uncharacterized membrane protein YeiH